MKTFYILSRYQFTTFKDFAPFTEFLLDDLFLSTTERDTCILDDEFVALQKMSSSDTYKYMYSISVVEKAKGI